LDETVLVRLGVNELDVTE